ncbi:MAG: Mur ligase, partial [Pseudomonadota bacterium]
MTASSERMEYLDARRLTGPNLLWDKPGSILDVGCTDLEVPVVIDAWSTAVRRMLDAVGWSDETLCIHPLSGGVSLAFSAPIDALYTAAEINEWAWSVIAGKEPGESASHFDAMVDHFKRAIAEEINPPLHTLEQAARGHDVAFLWDDDDVSVGMGTGSQCWPFRELPSPGDVDWSRVHDIPVGIVTGTNGKTTTVRLATHIGRVA